MDVRNIISQYRPGIESYFRRHCCSPSEVEDLIQDVYCAVTEGFPRIRNTGNRGAWIMAICRNVYVNHVRREVRIRKAEEYYGSPENPGSEVHSPDQDTRLTLDLFLESIAPDERTLYTLRYRENYSIREISEYLEKPEGTVKYLLHLIRNRLKTLM